MRKKKGSSEGKERVFPGTGKRDHAGEKAVKKRVQKKGSRPVRGNKSGFAGRPQGGQGVIEGCCANLKKRAGGRNGGRLGEKREELDGSEGGPHLQNNKRGKAMFKREGEKPGGKRCKDAEKETVSHKKEGKKVSNRIFRKALTEPGQ